MFSFCDFGFSWYPNRALYKILIFQKKKKKNKREKYLIEFLDWFMEPILASGYRFTLFGCWETTGKERKIETLGHFFNILSAGNGGEHWLVTPRDLWASYRNWKCTINKKAGWAKFRDALHNFFVIFAWLGLLTWDFWVGFGFWDWVSFLCCGYRTQWLIFCSIMTTHKKKISFSFIFFIFLKWNYYNKQKFNTIFFLMKTLRKPKEEKKTRPRGPKREIG